GAVGTYAVYSFIASFLAAATPLRGPQVGYALFLLGASAGVGLIIGGNATDKLGVRAVIRTSLCVLALALAGLSTVAQVLPSAIALPPVLLALTAWGLSGWAFFPAQQTGLIQIVGVKLAPIVLSLNASLAGALFPQILWRRRRSDFSWKGSRPRELPAVIRLGERISRQAVAPRLCCEGQGSRPIRGLAERDHVAAFQPGPVDADGRGHAEI